MSPLGVADKQMSSPVLRSPSVDLCVRVACVNLRLKDGAPADPQWLGAPRLTSLPYIMRWCVAMSALKTTIQLLLLLRSSSVSARWGMLTFSSLVQWIRSGGAERDTRSHGQRRTTTTWKPGGGAFKVSLSKVSRGCMNLLWSCHRWATGTNKNNKWDDEQTR